MAKSKGKHPKGYHSKQARYARKLSACEKCQEQAARILEVRPRKARGPRKPRKQAEVDAINPIDMFALPKDYKVRAGRRIHKKKPKKVYSTAKKIRFDENGNPYPQRKKRPSMSSEAIKSAARAMVARDRERSMMLANSMGA